MSRSSLLPPDVREWLPSDHLVWLLLDSVAVMDLSGFYASIGAVVTPAREERSGTSTCAPSVLHRLRGRRARLTCATGDRTARRAGVD